MGLTLLGGLTFTLQAADGTIKTKVKFIQFTCNLTAASKNMSVPLGDINRSQLAKKGDRSPQVFFELKATECPTMSKSGVGLIFAGISPPGDYRAFTLDKDSTALGVAVKIKSTYGYEFVPGSREATFSPNSAGEATLSYAAQYVALNDNVTPGTANLTTQIELFYY